LRILILTFSGTGNTAFVVLEFIKALQQRGITAASYPLENLPFAEKPEEILSADLIGIAFPVHAFNPPPLVEKIFKQLPVAAVKKCFILKTAGSPFANGGTTSWLKQILRSKHWKLQYEALIPMPSNFLIRYQDGLMKLIAQMAVKLTQRIADEIVNGSNQTIPESTAVRVLSESLKIERIGARFYGRFLKVDSACTQCGRCVRDCPTQNIRLENGKFSFGWTCTLCMRCSFYCPVQAFNHKHLGRLAIIKPPYDLEGILNNPEIRPADSMDKSIPYLRDFREFWLRAGILG
jgi:ferredoxin/flavodoxin